MYILDNKQNMIEIKNDSQQNSQEENEIKIKKYNIKDSNIKTDSKIKEKNLYSNYSIDDEEYLRYDKPYKPLLMEKSDFCQRKSSMISTTISSSEHTFENNSTINNTYAYNNSIEIDKITINSNTCLQSYLGRVRFNSNPIYVYYESTSDYFKSLTIKGKNDYRKSSNYIDKKIFFNPHCNSFDYIKINSKDNKDICLDRNETKKSYENKNLTKFDTNTRSQNFQFINNYSSKYQNDFLFEPQMNKNGFFNINCKSKNIIKIYKYNNIFIYNILLYIL